MILFLKISGCDEVVVEGLMEMMKSFLLCFSGVESDGEGKMTVVYTYTSFEFSSNNHTQIWQKYIQQQVQDEE